MEPHDFLDDDLKSDAALFVLDAFKVEEARAYRLHLAQCRTCRSEVESLARTARDLALVAPERTPPKDLWQRVLARVRKSDLRANPDSDADSAEPALRPESVVESSTDRSHAGRSATQIWKHWSPNAEGKTPDFTFLAASEGGFEPTDVPGIEAKKLFVDRENDRVTMLVRMQPGTAYPRHVHADFEECYVLSGDLSVGAQRMNAGDYQRAETGSLHAVQSTEHGCMLLLVSSLHDELI